ncbi:MAG: hypothetical protein J5996_05255 [Prevotella sp.]|nr:hypothetical protein [Prevotella sp.]
MDKEKAERIIKIYNWVRYIILVLFLAFVFIGLSKAQNTNDIGMWISAGTEKMPGLLQTTFYGLEVLLASLLLLCVKALGRTTCWLEQENWKLCSEKRTFLHG